MQIDVATTIESDEEPERAIDSGVPGDTSLPRPSSPELPEIPPAGMSVPMKVFKCLSTNLRSVWTSLKPLWNTIRDQSAELSILKTEVRANFESINDKLDKLLQSAQLPIPERPGTSVAMVESHPQVGITHRIKHLRRLETLDTRDVWEEWTIGVPIGGNALEAPLKVLEDNKKNDEYRDFSDKALKTAVGRRVHIARHLEAKISEHQLVSNMSYEDAVMKAIDDAEATRTILGKNGQKCSLYRFWEHIRGYKMRT